MFKIAVTGPESTGKSIITKQLASHYKAVMVPEYARKYINKLNRPYNQGDILKIAKGQYRSESYFAKKQCRLLFCDTEFIVLKVWYIYRYDFCPGWILKKIKTNRYDLFLLMNIDLKWESDSQREHPGLRRYFMKQYEEELKSYNYNYSIISGQGDERLANAIKVVDSFLKGK